MRRRWLPCAFVLSVTLAGCGEQREQTQSTSAPLEATSLVRSDRDVPKTAHHPLSRFSLRRGARVVDLGLAFDGVLLPSGVALLVRPDDTLEAIDETFGARTLARDALPDLALRGTQLAFVRRAGDGCALFIVEGALAGRETVRAVATPGLVEADRPLFVDDRTLLFVGTAPSSLPSFHRIDLQTLRVTKLKTTSEAIPAFRKGYAVVGDEVRFDDGEHLRGLDLRTLVVRDLGVSP